MASPVVTASVGPKRLGAVCLRRPYRFVIDTATLG
jgi:hypothetical protein